MIIRAYVFAWAAAFALAGILNYIGAMNDIGLTILGFIFATLAFTAPVAVLPWWVDKHYSWAYQN